MRGYRRWSWLVGVVAGVLPAAVCAGGIDRLKAFTRETQTARAQFSQVVVDKAGKRVQQSSGTLLIARPGKFRWSYERPYRQLLVGDGEKVWIYDEDLNQVSVKKVDQAIGATPAALLAGSEDFERAFELSDLPAAGGLEWLAARPRTGESPFSEIRVGFQGSVLATLELIDNFGQRTTITVSGLERNPKLGAGEFRFTPPKGADVIGDGSIR